MIERLKKNKVLMTGGVAQEEIERAEKKLNFYFPEIYTEVLEQCGALSAKGFEVLGLNVTSYLNVVETTLIERERSDGQLDNYVVIMKEPMDGILYVMDEAGEVFEYFGGEIDSQGLSFEDFLNKTFQLVG